MQTPIAASILAALALPALALSPGDEVNLAAISKAEFVKGAAPESWQEGNLYILECWATWCGPCIAAIPHVDGLYDKYHEKGLNIIGMNVWEDGKDKVVAFVEEKGDGMSYPVAYVGQDGPFQKEWLEAAGVRGIPHAFLVKDGKLLFGAHPSSLTEETIEEILAGGDREKAVVDKIQKTAANKEATQTQVQAFMQASQDKDTSAMEAAIAEIEKLDVDFPFISRMKTDVAVMKEDWEGATRILTAIDDERMAMMTAATVVQRTDSLTEGPTPALLDALATALSSSSFSDPTLKAALARVEWKRGEKDKALAAAEEAAAEPGRLPQAPLEAFAASFKAGEPQTFEELIAALQTAQ